MDISLIDLKYITTIYGKLSSKQIKKINNFLKDNFNKNTSHKSSKNNFDFEPSTIIILAMIDNNIVGCICLLNNKYLLEKINLHNISQDHYFLIDDNGCFIYNLCVNKFYRNNKIGYNLIKYTIDQMIEIKVKYLHTQAENEIARTLFINNGLTENKSIINSNNVKIYIMSRYL